MCLDSFTDLQVAVLWEGGIRVLKHMDNTFLFIMHTQDDGKGSVRVVCTKRLEQGEGMRSLLSDLAGFPFHLCSSRSTLPGSFHTEPGVTAAAQPTLGISASQELS